MALLWNDQIFFAPAKLKNHIWFRRSNARMRRDRKQIVDGENVYWIGFGVRHNTWLNDVMFSKKNNNSKKVYMCKTAMRLCVACTKRGYTFSYISLKCDDCAFHCILYGRYFLLITNKWKHTQYTQNCKSHIQRAMQGKGLDSSGNWMIERTKELYVSLALV